MSNLVITLKARQLGRDNAGRQIRENAGISVRQLAKNLQIDVGTLSRWERGECTPRDANAARWVEACNLIQRSFQADVVGENLEAKR